MSPSPLGLLSDRPPPTLEMLNWCASMERCESGAPHTRVMLQFAAADRAVQLREQPHKHAHHRHMREGPLPQELTTVHRPGVLLAYKCGTLFTEEITYLAGQILSRSIRFLASGLRHCGSSVKSVLKFMSGFSS